MNIYVASKVHHAPLWIRKRESWRSVGINIVSTWIDQMEVYEEGLSSVQLSASWIENVNDLRRSDIVVVFRVPSDHPLRGSLVEAGMGLALNKPIIICSSDIRRETDFGTWQTHPLVHMASTLDGVLATLCMWKKVGTPIG